MKKLLLTILTTICTVAGFAQDIAYKTLTFSAETNSKAVSSYTNTWSGTVGGFTWDIVNFNNNNNGWSYVRCGSKNDAIVSYITTSTAIDKAITKVELTIDAVTAANVNSVKLLTSTTSDFTTPKETVDITIAKGTQTATLTNPAENLYYQLVFDCAQKSNGSLQLSKVVYYTAGGGETKTPTSLTFSTTEVTYDMASGESFTAPTLTTAPADLTGVTYTSSDPTVATVNETTGAVTILAKGTTIITATFAETATHYGSNATYTLKVKDTTVAPGYFNFVDWAFPGAEDWTTSYAARTAAYTEATVTFASANKQSATAVIADCPVTKNDPVTVVLTNTANDIESFSANFEQWGTKEKTVTLYTSIDGVNFTATDITTSTFAFTTTTLEKGVKAIRFVFSKDDNQIGIADITIKEVKGQGKIPTNLTFSETSVTYNMAGEDPFVAPTLTTDPEGLAGITYTSSDPTVATVNEDGDVSILAEGTTTITATFAENDTYLGSTASYTLTVTKSKGTITAELNFVGWTFPGADSGWSAYKEQTVTFPEAVVWFKSVSKQGEGMSITDCPVTRGGDITVTLNGSGTSEILSFSAEFEQWSDKKQTVTLYTSTDGENYTATTTTTSNFSFGKTTLDSGVKAIMFKFSSTSNQIGLRSVTLEILSDTTPVNGVEAAPTTGNRIYNLAGQRVSATKSGLYILNGKKVIIK
ncbi:MAG: Ig-like domain-containing protein [Bacteroidaceae bacterium]|nr:Ig-like domain-containing protein [Bacteroidaceae bacterium]